MSDRELAPAKVNLCLFLGGSRPDGRHELLTLFESITLFDELELTAVPQGGADEVVCPGVDGPNLVEAALGELRARGWSAPPVRIEITKRIPVAAGLGGGSADAAAALRLAARLDPVPGPVLEEIAAGLGADVPSQLRPGLSLGTGAGDQVSPRPALGEHAFLIVPQPVMLSTADVYREADRLSLPRAREELDALRPRLDGTPDDSLLVNDLERAALSLCPQIADALSAVREAGADRAMVSGSGPTVFGLFWGDDAWGRADQAAAWIPGAVAARPISSWPCGTI
jgi:4-diphosphocytidyl-2-C-methyl-D-erythritol kinase